MCILIINTLCIEDAFPPFLPSKHPCEVSTGHPHTASELMSPAVLCPSCSMIVPFAHSALRVERD